MSDSELLQENAGLGSNGSNDEGIDDEDIEDSIGWRQRGGRWMSKLRGKAGSQDFRVTWKYALCAFIAVLVAAILSLIIGVVAGRSLGKKASTAAGGGQDGYNWGDTVVVEGRNESVAEYFASHLSEADIRDYLFNLTVAPHIAGGQVNRELAEMIYRKWQTYNFDSVELFNYSVLLSYPNTSNPNTLTLRDSNGETLYQSHIALEPPLTPGENDPRVVPPFNAFSGSGNVTGPLVYVNYGRLRDFEYITTNSSGPQLDLSQYICIVRYGQIFRGHMARLAEQHGCRGLLIYSDPYDYAPEGIPVYPNGPSLPEFGVQRGTLQIPAGDILTPGVPSIAGIHRRTYSEARSERDVPRIPVQPISYGDAIHFLSQLSDHTPPSDWVGGLEMEYRIAQSDQNANVTELVVNNYQERRTIHNVVAKLYGGVEPDRQVILGNHRDAWVFGAVDPSSATAPLLDIAKVIGQLRRYDWRPGRTMVLCSWDAEEYGLIGSTEWVEEHSKLLGAITMAYLNLDISVLGGAHIEARATPLMYEVMWQSAAKVPCPNEGYDTLYEEWLNNTRKMYKGEYRPTITGLGSGSDYAAFLQRLGVSSTDFIYLRRGAYYAVYHSVHDNFNWMSSFGDPLFTYHRAVATMWITAALMLTTTPLPPLDPSHYSYLLVEEATSLNQQYGQLLSSHGVSLDLMLRSVSELDAAIHHFQEDVKKVSASANISDWLNVIRIINDKLMNMERAFIHPEGLPGRVYTKNVIFAPSSINTYNSATFPSVYDAITDAIGANATTSASRWEEVKRQVDVVATHVRHATQIITEPSLKYAL